MIRNILLKIRYDGTEFSGWQRQPNVQTVQGEVERVLSILCNRRINVDGTSRTDAGVHAEGQQATFCGDFAIPTENIKRAANNLLNPAVEIVDVKEVPADFHSRYNSCGKTYEYRIINSRRRNPFKRNYVYYVDRHLDTENMKKALQYIKGTHDFMSFQAAGGDIRETTVRTIYDISIKCDAFNEKPDNDDSRWFPPKAITISVTGDGFLYNMVRIIVGTLVDVGLGKINPDDLSKIISGCDRRLAGHTAPPQGLCLKKVFFEKPVL